MATVNTKFDVGQEVWIMTENGLNLVTINRIDVKIFNGCDSISYEVFDIILRKQNVLESNLFATKEELIKSL